MKNIKTGYLLIILLCLGSCKKFLDKKSNQRLVTLTNINDIQAVLNNTFTQGSAPALADVAADEYYLSNTDWDNFGASYWLQRPYIWSTDDPYGGVAGQTQFDWRYCYDNVLRANLVLNSIDDVSSAEADGEAYYLAKGLAYYLRARCFLDAVIIWAKAYDETTAKQDMGIPIRVDPDFNTVSTRASIYESYHQVLADLKAAAQNLPDATIHPVRASRPAAYGLLARTYLAMRNYDSAYHYAQLCLSIKSDLLDFNTLASSTATYPMPIGHIEVLHFTSRLAPTTIAPNRAKIDSVLYNQFDANDLRKLLYFRSNNNGTYFFRGTYSGSVGSPFGGIATDEVWLMLAECQARKGMTSEAMESLNTLLRKRWRNGTFTDLTAATAQEALAVILQERRKELIFRGLRWMDVKRLNKEGYNITLRRVIHGNLYELPPNDPRFALPIPLKVIELTNMPQN
jgi:tetratricopeptide (TPR) repeat protein